MKLREIKAEDIRVGAKVIHKGYPPTMTDMVRTIISTENENSPYDDAVTYDSDGWDYVNSVLNYYYLVESDGDTVDELRVGESSSAYNNLTTGIPIFDGDINKQVGGNHYTKNDPIQFAKDNYPPEHLEGFYRINVDKYMARYDKKNGIEDIKKAKHYIEMLLELKEQQNAE